MSTAFTDAQRQKRKKRETYGKLKLELHTMPQPSFTIG